MQQSKASQDQHIAVFGESGSGKTVMLSSFYGATQEPDYLRESLFNIVADDQGQGRRLHQNYLGMRNSARRPAATRFSATTYSFSLLLRNGNAKAKKNQPFDKLRLVWHDYPGEWFEDGVSGPEEAQRRVRTFRDLLGSDIALLLVDGQRLLDNAGEEERYLKSLLSNLRNGLLPLKDELLPDGKPLVKFPRIWVLALSKADLLPNMNVFEFRDLLIEKVGEDIEELRRVIAGFVEDSDALSVGDDYMLLSSARFGTDKIEVTNRVGLDLILPLATMLPLERYARWVEAMHDRGKVAEYLLSGAGALAGVLVGLNLKGRIGSVLNSFGPGLIDAAELVGEKLKEVNDKARAKHEDMKAILTGFKMDLDQGEEERIFLRSRR
ncbi:ATP-binding protein [Micromonospora fulviviridis]|uniref:TRAFAC clade GTPase domain-containing protein n=1 Tax=Micromonospora fulviviridis TaxID=47860 RepID=UPI0016663C4D|nr:ATP/GTP-binding protein [Micromonospora fulviviridis]GGR77875.1 ATP-binding protein [Micromonospora fulviviridis]